MTAKQILQEGRTLIEKGWTQEKFARDADGDAVLAKSPRACAWCAEGALYAVEKNFLAVGEAISLLDDLAKDQEYDSACDFNDHPDTTREDVLDLYNKAIKRCEDDN